MVREEIAKEGKRATQEESWREGVSDKASKTRGGVGEGEI